MLGRLAAGAIALTVLGALPAQAAPAPPTGTIEIVSALAGPSYGDTVNLTTTIDGKVSRNSRVYVTVICRQDVVVYQWSKWNDSGEYSFPLRDQAGQGLDWDGGPASCEASLIYRVEKGRSAQLSTLDAVEFDVA